MEEARQKKLAEEGRGSNECPKCEGSKELEFASICPSVLLLTMVGLLAIFRYPPYPTK